MQGSDSTTLSALTEIVACGMRDMFLKLLFWSIPNNQLSVKVDQFRNKILWNRDSAKMIVL